MVRIILGLTLACLLNVAGANAATLIYGSVFQGPSSPSTLWAFLPGGVGNDFQRIVGPIGFLRVGALDFSPSGKLYGVGSGNGQAVLITINTATGAGMLVGSLQKGDLFVQDIAFRPSDGTLFAFAEGNIYTINTTTGAATLLGDPGVGFPFGNSLAFRGGTLYYANETALYTINQSTAVATLVHTISYQPAFGTFPRPAAMKFDPVTGALWASVVGNLDNLATIDRSPARRRSSTGCPSPRTALP